MKNYLNAIRNYANIKGRMARHEFWQFMLLNYAFWQLSSLLGALLSLIFLPILYPIVLIVPTITAIVRRIHDTGKSAKWVLLLAALAGFSLMLTIASISNGNVGYNKYVNVTYLFILVSLLAMGFLVYKLSIAGDVGANKYGPDPKEVKSDEGEGL